MYFDIYIHKDKRYILIHHWCVGKRLWYVLSFQQYSQSTCWNMDTWLIMKYLSCHMSTYYSLDKRFYTGTLNVLIFLFLRCIHIGSMCHFKWPWTENKAIFHFNNCFMLLWTKQVNLVKLGKNSIFLKRRIWQFYSEHWTRKEMKKQYTSTNNSAFVANIEMSLFLLKYFLRNWLSVAHIIGGHVAWGVRHMRYG